MIRQATELVSSCAFVVMMETVAPMMLVSMECAYTHSMPPSLDALVPPLPTCARQAMLATPCPVLTLLLGPSVLDFPVSSAMMETTAQTMLACGTEERLIMSTAPTLSTQLSLVALLFLEVSLVDRLQESLLEQWLLLPLLLCWLLGLVVSPQLPLVQLLLPQHR